MRVARLTYRVPPDGQIVTYVRDARQVGGFLRGVECNAWGVAAREGCSEEVLLMVREDRITAFDDLAENPPHPEGETIDG